MKKLLIIGLTGITLSSTIFAEETMLPEATGSSQTNTTVSATEQTSEVSVERDIARRRRHHRRRHRRHRRRHYR